MGRAQLLTSPREEGAVPLDKEPGPQPLAANFFISRLFRNLRAIVRPGMQSGTKGAVESDGVSLDVPTACVFAAPSLSAIPSS